MDQLPNGRGVGWLHGNSCMRAVQPNGGGSNPPWSVHFIQWIYEFKCQSFIHSFICSINHSILHSCKFTPVHFMSFPFHFIFSISFHFISCHVISFIHAFIHSFVCLRNLAYFPDLRQLKRWATEQWLDCTWSELYWVQWAQNLWKKPIHRRGGRHRTLTDGAQGYLWRFGECNFDYVWLLFGWPPFSTHPPLTLIICFWNGDLRNSAGLGGSFAAWSYTGDWSDDHSILELIWVFCELMFFLLSQGLLKVSIVFLNNHIVLRRSISTRWTVLSKQRGSARAPSWRSGRSWRLGRSWATRRWRPGCTRLWSSRSWWLASWRLGFNLHVFHLLFCFNFYLFQRLIHMSSGDETAST